MARQARALSPTGCYHVMMRGNNKENVFYSEALKNQFIKIMMKYVDQYDAKLLAWCVMDNHVHIVLRTDSDQIGQIFKSINVSYAMQYNVDHKRVGHVFQDRFKSEVIVDDKHLLAVIRYVHRNPQKSGLVERLEDYVYSSYSSILKYAKDQVDSIYNEVLQLFGGSIKQLIDFHMEEDEREYLEMPEEINQQRLFQAHKIIEVYFKENAGDKVSDILIHNLLTQSRLSHRKIAELLSVSARRVDGISRVSGI